MQTWFNRTTMAQKIFMWLLVVAPLIGLLATQEDKTGILFVFSPAILLLSFFTLGYKKKAE